MTKLELTFTLSAGALAWNADQLSSKSKVEHWPSATRIWWQWQQDTVIFLKPASVFVHLLIVFTDEIWFVISAASLEPLLTEPSADIHGSSGCSESHCLVPSPTWPSGLWRRNCRPLYSILEHADVTAAAVCGHRFSGLQPDLVQTC